MTHDVDKYFDFYFRDVRTQAEGDLHSSLDFEECPFCQTLLKDHYSPDDTWTPCRHVNKTIRIKINLV